MPSLSPAALRKQIAAGATDPLYVLLGEDEAEKAATGAAVWLHPLDRPLYDNAPEQGRWFGIDLPPLPAPDRAWSGGDRVTVGGLAFEVRHVPGHSPGHVALVGHGLDGAGEVRVVDGEAPVVEDPGGDRQAEPLDERAQLVLRAGHRDVGACDEERALRVEQRVPDRSDHSGVRDGAHVGWARGLDHGLDVGRLEGRARVGDVDRARRERHRLLERAARDGRDAARVPHLPPALGDVLDRAHLGEARGCHERAVIAVRPDVAHGGGDDHRRPVEYAFCSWPEPWRVPAARCTFTKAGLRAAFA